MRFGGLLTLMPAEFAPLLLVMGGLAMIVRARKIASICLISAAAMLILPAVLEPLLAAVPMWVLIVATPLLAIAVLTPILGAIFGGEAMNIAWGRWLSRYMGWLLLLTTVAMVAALGWELL